MKQIIWIDKILYVMFACLSNFLFLFDKIQLLQMWMSVQIILRFVIRNVSTQKGPTGVNVERDLRWDMTENAI